MRVQSQAQLASAVYHYLQQHERGELTAGAFLKGIKDTYEMLLKAEANRGNRRGRVRGKPFRAASWQAGEETPGSVAVGESAELEEAHPKRGGRHKKREE